MGAGEGKAEKGGGVPRQWLAPSIKASPLCPLMVTSNHGKLFHRDHPGSRGPGAYCSINVPVYSALHMIVTPEQLLGTSA